MHQLPPHRLKVLCVDDNPHVLIGLARQLDRHFEVLTAISGPEGLGLLEEHSDVAVVISDLRMPAMNGIEFLQQAIHLSPDSVRMILTAFGDVVELSTALQNNLIFRVLDKPCSTRKLVAAVEAAAGRFRRRAQAY